MVETKKKIRERLIGSFGRLKSDSFYFESIEKYFRNKNHNGDFQVLTDKTCKDLDFNELFMFADRTTSYVGQQFLYDTLRTIPPNGDKFVEQEKLIDQITNDSSIRLELQIHLDKLTRESTYFITTLFQDEYIKKPKWFFIIPVCSFASLFALLLIPFIPQFFFVLLAVMIINLGIHYWNKQNIHEYIGTIPQLLALNRVAQELFKYNMLKKISIDLPESIKIIDKVRHRMSFFRLEAKFQSDLGVFFWSFMELIKALFLLEPLILFGVLKQLNLKRKEIENVFSFVGYVDLLISIASLRQGLDFFCLPEINVNSKVIEAIEIYHPLIVNCVPNSINCSGKSILLTGSNMSGKTSFIRTVGLNTIRLKIYSAIRLSDDLVNDKSYYFEEVLTIKEMIEKSKMPGSNLFLLDEIFKGTNTIERISAGRAVLSYLNNESNIVFVSTHDIELADLLQSDYKLFHFSEQVDNKTVDFDFKLKEGKLENRNAIRILEINGYPMQIITEAIDLSKKLDKIYDINKID
jgi:hypothetical protein